MANETRTRSPRTREGTGVRGLASYIMRGRMQATTVVLACLVVGLIIPPFSLVAGGVVAFVALRNGVIEGLFVAAMAVGIVGVVAAIATSGAPLVVAGLIILMAPVLLLAWILRSTVSLPAVLVTAAVIGIAMVLGVYGVVGDPAGWWKEMLRPLMEPTLNQPELQLDQSAVDNIIDSAATRMTGAIAAIFVASYLTCLFIGRAWQALLYNPGGFRREFLSIGLNKRMAFVTLAVFLVATLVSGGMGGFAANLLQVLGILYLIVGTAVVHRLLEVKRVMFVFVILFYVALLFPLIATSVAILGWLDTWADLRSRVATNKPGDNSGGEQ